MTESGFGSDMGFEKLLDIVCPAGGLTPSAAVLVVSAGSVKHHGGDATATGEDALAAIERGMANVRRHLGIVETFGLPCVVAINRRPGDTDEELALLRERCLEAGAVDAQVSDGFQHGGAGTTELARAVLAACEAPNRFAPLYEPDDSPLSKLRSHRPARLRRDRRAPGTRSGAQARAVRGAGPRPAAGVRRQDAAVAVGRPALVGAPEGFTLTVRDVRAYTGAGWLVALCGDVQQMPGLGPKPSALNIDIDADGNTVGLF